MAPGCQSGFSSSLLSCTHFLYHHSLTFWLPSPPYLCLSICLHPEDCGKGCSSAAVEVAPLCLSRAVSQEILSPVLFSLQRGKLVELLSVGRQGRDSSSSNSQIQYQAQWAKRKVSPREKLFLKLEVIDLMWRGASRPFKGFGLQLRSINTHLILY